MAGRQIAVARIHNLDDGLIEVCGVGEKRATAAAERLIGSGAQSLASFGVCAALHPSLRCGEVVIPSEVGTAEFLRTDDAWLHRLVARLDTRFTVHRGRLAHAATVLHSSDNKRLLADRTGAMAADMESLAIAKVARRHNVPFVALRVVLDDAAASLPGWITSISDPYGSARLLPTLTQVLRDRSAVRELRALARLAATASVRLSEIRNAVGLGLCARQS